MVKTLHIKNANIWTEAVTEKRDLFCSDVILNQPVSDALILDLDGYTIFPGLINAHDHLELNHYPRTKFREVYNNAHEWGEDVNARLDTEPYQSLRQYPIWDRLFIGGLKNLLCGATTVVHHGTKYRELYRKDFPVRVLKDYGWSHSLHFDTEKDIITSYKNTPEDTPWFIHLAEGTDEIAKSEYQHLKRLGCIDNNTVIVHGVGLTAENLSTLRQNKIKSIVVCPSTNQYLLNKTPPVKTILDTGIKVMIGSDSYLTADGDLLDEFKYVDDPLHLLSNNQYLLGWNKTPLSPNTIADWIAIPTDTSFQNLKRRQISLIVKNGIPQMGDPDLMAKFNHIKTVSAILDGIPKSINISLARQIQKCKLKEHGLELTEAPSKRFWIF